MTVAIRVWEDGLVRTEHDVWDWEHGCHGNLVSAHGYDIAGHVCEDVGPAEHPRDHHPAEMEVWRRVWDHGVHEPVDPHVADGFDGLEDAVVVHEDGHVAQDIVWDGIGDQVVAAVDQTQHVYEPDAVASGTMHESVVWYVSAAFVVHASEESCKVRAS